MFLRGRDREILSRPLRAVIVAVLTLVYLTRPGYGLNPDKSISQYAHSAWRVQDGFTGAETYGITQTADGYIWIATTSGLVRFDGVRFFPWAPPGNEELRSLAVYAILGTSDGSLWFATAARGLWQWKNANLTKYVVPGNDSVGSIVEKGQGKVWFTRIYPQNDSSPLCEAGQGKVECYALQKELGPRCCTALAEDKNGDLWLGGTDLIKWRSRSSSTEVIKIHGALPNMVVTSSVAALSDGSAWIGIVKPGPFGGLQHRLKTGWSHYNSPMWDSSSIGVTSVLADRHGALWVGSVDQGLYRIWDGKVDHFRSQDGLSGNRVRSLFEDHEGNLWVMTTEGLDCFRNLASTAYSSNQGLRAAEFDTVIATRDGTVWTGGERSLDRLRGGKIFSSITGKNLPGEQVTSMLQDSLGRVWVGIDNTLSILKNNKFTQIRRPDGRSLGMVVGMTEDNNKNIWAAVSRSPRELVKITGSRVVQELPMPQLPAARKVAADAHGGLWLGLMDGGLAHYQQGKVDIFRFSDKKESWVNEVGVEPDGSVLGATGYGLIGWRDGKQRKLTTRNGLPCDGVNAFIRDDQHALWLYTPCGLIQLSPREVERWWNDPDAVLQIRLFDSTDGVNPGETAFEGIARSPDGKLWFVDTNSLHMIDPDHLPRNLIAPPFMWKS